MTQRVAVTGLGVISPVGIGIGDFWSALINGKSGIGRISQFDPAEFSSQIAGEVDEFDPAKYFPKKEARRMDRFSQFAVAAAGMALDDSGLDLNSADRDRIGVILGSGIGGIKTFEEQAQVLLQRGPGRISPFFVPGMIANIGAGQVGIYFDLRGPNITTVTACASSSNALGEAFKTIQRGQADVMVSGGTEAPISPLAVGGFCSMKALSTCNDRPQSASRPFDARRDGFVISEGAVVLVLERLDKALLRGARIYGEIIGYGSTCDAYHITAPDPEGRGAAKAMEAALLDAGLKPEEVSYINAHGTSTPLNDKLETMAIKRVFGEHAKKLMISSTKSMTGHLLGAAGALEAAACLLALSTGIVPPTINYEFYDEDCDLNYVPNSAQKADLSIALSNSLGFGGHNASLLMRKYA